MHESEDKPPTLANLRARRGKIRSAKRLSFRPTDIELPNQADLFSANELAPSPPVKPSASRKRSSSPRIKIQGGAALSATVSAVRRVWNVRNLVSDIRQHVEMNFTDLWVEGEISNCRPAPSGHLYFTLKDGEAQLPVVLFRRHLSLLKFRPGDGLVVLVRGRISVYESRGQLQLIAETIEPRGAGALHLAFEQLKARLLAKGLFDAGRKRSLPSFPKCIGIVTSSSGAVIRDIATIVQRRHARLNILVYPAVMQGISSPESVIAGIRWFNANRSLVDVIVIARGGGALEDLSGFNDEALARVIASSELPIVSAVGHETDFTIADFAADLRAPTPSAAAELITAAQHQIEERISALAARIQHAERLYLMSARHRYARLAVDSALNRVHDSFGRRDQRLDELHLRLESSTQRRMRTATHGLLLRIDRLRHQDLGARISAIRHRLQSAEQRLHRSTARIINPWQTRLGRASAGLGALSPIAVLSRGYALVYRADGRLLRSAADTSAGQTILARLSHGTVEAEVRDTNIGAGDVREIRNA